MHMQQQVFLMLHTLIVILKGLFTQNILKMLFIHPHAFPKPFGFFPSSVKRKL